jgi:excisionase family DNA binding protein
MMNTASVPKLLVSKHDAAASLGISVRTVENLISRKQLPTRKIGRRTLIALSELQRFVRSDRSKLPSGLAV